MSVGAGSSAVGRLSDGIRLAAAAEEADRLERALAAARCLLALLLLAVEVVGAIFHGRPDDLAVALLAIYAVWSAAAFLWIRRRGSAPALRRVLHGFDVVWAGLLTLAGHDLFLLVSVLALYGAASRWGLRQALFTAGAVCAVLLVQQAFFSSAALPVQADAWDPRRFFFRAAFLLVLGFLFGHLTRRERQLRAETIQAKAMERALVARELHDGAIQSLIGMEVQMDVLRRQAGLEAPAMAGELGRIQELLRQEVLNLRELMQQMKPLDLDPRQLPDFLAETVDRFRRDTGISASFVSGLREVTLPSRICLEIARIAQEALVNVRKHSGARNVIVRLSLENGSGKLVVDDDGRGFDFSGRFSQEDLDSARKGPVIIKERVRAIGGALTIESEPGRGARLEIRFPNE